MKIDGKEIPIERLRDPKFYLENFCKIKTKKRGLEPFILNNVQLDMFNTMRKHNRIMLLKARQLGASTGVVGYFYVDTIMNPGTTTALIGYNSDLVTELLDKVQTFWRTTPAEFRPTIKYNSKYEISFPKIDSKIIVLPSTGSVGAGYTLNNCLYGKTKILIGNGLYKNIEDIKSGDIILNGNGGKTFVKGVIKKPLDNKLLDIKISGHYDNLILTQDHKILTREFKTGKEIWKEAKDITKEDYIAFPYFQCRNRYKDIEISKYIKDGYESRSVSCEDKIVIDYNFGLFIGWYLAEGHIDKKMNRIILCINKNEIDEVLKVIEPFRKYVGKITTDTKKDTNSTTIDMQGGRFAKFIESIFGRTENKRIDDIVWYWGWDFCKGLLFGIFSGDGCFTNIRSVILTNVNESLINQVKKLLVSLRIGLAPIVKRKSCRYGIDGKDRFDIIMSGKGNYKFRRIFGLELPKFDNNKARWIDENAKYINQGGGYWKRGRFHYWAKIKDIKKYEGNDIKYVYDIVLDKNPHSFTTVCGVVHNCLLTELAKWDNAEEKMMTLEPAVPIDGKIVIESTPEGVGSLYHRMWVSNEEYIKKEYGWWWGYGKDEIEVIKRRMNNPRMFAQEYGLSFLTSGNCVFDESCIREQEEYLLKEGDDNNGFIVKKEGSWMFYRPQEPNGLYCVGCDVGEGVTGGDYSVAIMWDRRTGEEVAMFRGLLAPHRLAEELNRVGRLYNNALMAVEVNNHGLTVTTVLRQLMYPSLYYRMKGFESLGQVMTDRIGWRTTSATRPLLIDDFAQALRDKELKIHSKILLDEMSVFIYNENGEMQPMKGIGSKGERYHDDTIFAAGIGRQAFKVMYSGQLLQIDESAHLPKNFAY